MDLVTAVITTCKRDKNILQRAIESIKNQTYEKIEIIVVDDSPDSFSGRNSVEEMVSSYKNIKYIKHEVNKGACAARNTGLKNANGKYIGYLDDDDEWLPEKIELQLSGFNNTDVGLVYCGRLFVNDKNNNKRSPRFPVFTGMVYRELMIRNFIGSTSFPLIRTSALNEIGGFDEKMESAQDYDVWLRLAEKYKVNFIDKYLVLYHLHENEQISTNPAKVIAGLEQLLEKNMTYLVNHKDLLCRRYLKLAYTYMKAGENKKAKDAWMSAAKIWPVGFPFLLWYLFKMLRIYLK